MNNCQMHLAYGTMRFSGVEAWGPNVTLGHLVAMS